MHSNQVKGVKENWGEVCVANVNPAKSWDNKIKSKTPSDITA